MRDDNGIIVGEKVDLTNEDGRIYRTMIEDIYENGSCLIGVPSIGGIPMLLHINDGLDMVFYRETGRFIAPMRVEAIERRGEIRYAQLKQTGQVSREQRRGAFRLPARVKVLVCEYTGVVEKHPYEDEADAKPDDEAAPGVKNGDIVSIAAQVAAAAQVATPVAAPVTLEAVASKDISFTGIGLTTRKEYIPGDTYLLKLHLKDPMEKNPLAVGAMVMRVFPGANIGTYHVGLRFVDLPRINNEIISKYVYAMQQRLLKQRRLSDN